MTCKNFGLKVETFYTTLQIHIQIFNHISESKTLVCESTHDEENFAIRYDKLVIAVGVKTNTFGIESIVEGDGIYFLKHLYHARMIRNNIIDSFEKAGEYTHFFTSLVF